MIIKVVLLTIVSFILGFIAGIPTGSVQVEVIKRALHDRLKPALAVIAGAFVADTIYGFIAFLGIMPFLRNDTFVGIFELICAVLLAVLSFFTFRHADRIHIGGIQQFVLKSKRVSFLIGFSLGIVNPVIIFWWLLSARLISDIGLSFTPHINFTLIVVISGAIGLGAYLTILAFLINWAKKFVSNSFIKIINYGLGVMLAGLSIYFFVVAIKRIF
jgi:threonine/homoserine/homoserine lactone efflux protein